jgi:NAD(P)-dependent dehydrogenase (short-subunit alcohol dehydrogenase family)
MAKFGPVDSVDEATFDEMVNVNFKGLFFNVQHALPVLNDNASIILTTTMADQKGYPGTSVYSATKAAVRSLARTLSAELVGRGIRVNAVSPGPIETPIFGKLGVPEERIPETKEGFRNVVPMKRFGSADEVAKPALFLASDDSSFVLGVELMVDGGTAQL